MMWCARGCGARWVRRAALLAAAACWLASTPRPCSGGEPNCRLAELQRGQGAAPHVVLLRLAVADGPGGGPRVPGLGIGHFRVVLDGLPPEACQLLSCAPSFAEPPRVALVVPTVGLGPDANIYALREAVGGLARALAAPDAGAEVALFTAGRVPRQATRFDRDAIGIERHVPVPEDPSTGAPLLRALQQAAEALPMRGGESAVVAFTNGRVDAGEGDVAAVIGELRRRGAHLFVVGLPWGPRAEESPVVRALLAAMPNAGPLAASPPDALAAAIRGRLASCYELAFQVRPTSGWGFEVGTASVRVEGGGRLSEPLRVCVERDPFWLIVCLATGGLLLTMVLAAVCIIALKGSEARRAGAASPT